jgi:hypothetical protein
MLSRSPVHAGARDGIDYGGGARREIGKTLDWFGFDVFYGIGRVGVYIERLRKP